MPIHDWSLVDAGIFHHLHLRWIGGLAEVLNGGLLPDPYYALAESALGEVVPDVLALKAKLEEAHEEEATRSEGYPESAVALAEKVVVQDLHCVDPHAVLVRRLAIRDASRGDELVAVIELVSRSNKASRPSCPTCPPRPARSRPPSAAAWPRGCPAGTTPPPRWP